MKPFAFASTYLNFRPYLIHFLWVSDNFKDLEKVCVCVFTFVFMNYVMPVADCIDRTLHTYIHTVLTV